jgi:hypothetical protein
MNSAAGDTVGMEDLRRIHYVAEHYEQLQGLRLLPLSVPFLLSALSRLAPSAARLSGRGWSVLLMSAIAGSALIGRYYSRRFGETHPFRWRSALQIAAGTAAFFALEWLQEIRPFPLPLPILFVAIVLARVGTAAGWLRSHYLWIAAACALFGLLPVLGVSLDVRAAALDALIGGGLAVAAIGDDRVLRRMMAAGSAS